MEPPHLAETRGGSESGTKMARNDRIAFVFTDNICVYQNYMYNYDGDLSCFKRPTNQTWYSSDHERAIVTPQTRSSKLAYESKRWRPPVCTVACRVYWAYTSFGTAPPVLYPLAALLLASAFAPTPWFTPGPAFERAPAVAATVAGTPAPPLLTLAPALAVAPLLAGEP
uniref:Uncharacterized protein n=1 Tax=Peronospora matthiolae TaxID=2874970 RepID=A0AAV1T520_9STRA